MANYTGVIRFNDLEGGFYELACDDGSAYRLQGTVETQVGTRVRVHGKIEKGGFGLQMTGPALMIERIEVID